jgi:hypothetical protein
MDKSGENVELPHLDQIFENKIKKIQKAKGEIRKKN